jgi:hypothetical protein
MSSTEDKSVETPRWRAQATDYVGTLHDRQSNLDRGSILPRSYLYYLFLMRIHYFCLLKN